MCGITGYYGGDRSRNAKHIESMTRSLMHRGPDGIGWWISRDGKVGLGHTRLSIIDLIGGSQPMHCSDNLVSIVFNGEIYNYKSLRQILAKKGSSFRTNSDTEVIIEAYKLWGNAFIEHLHGMFAIALYDHSSESLLLIRDHTGIKPLYYYDGPQGLFFGSELKAILTISETPRHLNYHALADSLVFSYPLMPKTFFREIREVEPGSWLLIKDNSRKKRKFWEWSTKNTIHSIEEAVEATHISLLESLEEHIISDVPIGAFLSSGIDSTLLVALLTQELGKEVDTFTVSFSDHNFDEGHDAGIVSKTLGTSHHQLTIDLSTLNEEIIKKIVNQFDQPFGDSSAIPSYLISNEISKYVKVAISGDGGDEMFGGYPRFRYADFIRPIGSSPNLQKLCSYALNTFRSISPDIYRRGTRLLESAKKFPNGHLTALSSYTSPYELESILTPLAIDSIKDYHPTIDIQNNNLQAGGKEFIDRTIKFALPGDYLRKIDISSSAHGLEVRVPFLGKQVLRCSASISTNLKYNWRTEKLILRHLVKQYLPDYLSKKPKTGFSIPLNSILNKSIRVSLSNQLLSPKSRISSIFNKRYIDFIASSFSDGNCDKSTHSQYMIYQKFYMLWSIEQWLEKWQAVL